MSEKISLDSSDFSYIILFLKVYVIFRITFFIS